MPTDSESKEVELATVLSQPTALDLESLEAGTLEEHWRKGIPTAILLFIAIFISAFYLVLVRPGIQQRYTSVVTANWKRLGIEQIAAPESNEISAPPLDASLKERIAILKDTQLSLRRLVGWKPTDDSIHYRYGIVSNLLSESYLREAAGIADKQSGGLASQYIGLAKTEYQNATGAMERVRRIGGTLAPDASLWLVKNKLENNYDPTADDLLKIESTVRDLVKSDSTSSAAKMVLGQILIERSLRYSSGLSIAERMKQLDEADQLLQSISSTEFQVTGLRAEACSVRDLQNGQELANKTLQTFWSTRDTESQSIESIAIAFRSLLIIDSFTEAQVLLSEQLRQIPPEDQSKFRAMASSAALQHLVWLALRDENIRKSNVANKAASPKSGINSTSFKVAFALAIQLSPESRELMTLLQSIAKPEGADPILSKIRDATMSDASQNAPRKGQPAPETGIAPFVKSIGGLGRSDLGEGTTSALSEAVKLSPAYGVAASRLAFQLGNSDSVMPEVAIRWLLAINTASPDILMAWSDRANLHLKMKQPAEAIKCLEFLLDKLPDSVQVLEALEAAKAQLKIGE